jgi:hypothetical protein
MGWPAIRQIPTQKPAFLHVAMNPMLKHNGKQLLVSLIRPFMHTEAPFISLLRNSRMGLKWHPIIG